MFAESRFKWGLPQPRVWGELIIFRRRKRKHRKQKILEPPSTLERRTPVFTLG